MRTTVDLPEKLLHDAQRVCGARTKTSTLILALQRLIDAKRIDDLRSLKGTLKLDIDLGRSRRIRDAA